MKNSLRKYGQRVLSQLILLVIICLTPCSELLAQDSVFNPDHLLVYEVKYTKESLVVLDTISIRTTGNDWKVDANQKEIIIEYISSHIDPELFENLPSLGWVKSDTTGAVESDSRCWFHPPRHNQYLILELAPFPRVEFPLEESKVYQRMLFIGDGWGEISNSKVLWSYHVKAYHNSEWQIEAIATPENVPNKKSQLNFSFNPERGFRQLDYQLHNGTSIVFNMLD